MSRRWIHANLDFEYEVRFGAAWTAPKAVRQHMERWKHVLRLVEGWQEAEAASVPQDGEWLFWGPTARLARMAGGHWPSESVLHEVNSKVFSHQLAKHLGVELPGAFLAHSVEEVAAGLGCGAVLVKHPLGFSGRERIELRDRPDEKEVGFIQGVLSEGPAIVEPKIQISREWSLQFEISSTVEYLGSAMLLADDRGQHRGHILGMGTPSAEIIETARVAAQRVQAAGYFGPLGVDAFEGILDGKRVIRPLSELNARMTFGRLAVELGRLVEGPLAWWHVANRKRSELEPQGFESAGSVRRLPEWADPQGASGSVLLVGRVEILHRLGERHTL